MITLKRVPNTDDELGVAAREPLRFWRRVLRDDKSDLKHQREETKEQYRAYRNQLKEDYRLSLLKLKEEFRESLQFLEEKYQGYQQTVEDDYIRPMERIVSHKHRRR